MDMDQEPIELPEEVTLGDVLTVGVIAIAILIVVFAIAHLSIEGEGNGESESESEADDLGEEDSSQLELPYDPMSPVPLDNAQDA